MFSSVSILPFSIPSPDSGPDLHIALTVLLLLFALLLLGTELRTVVRERIQYLWQGWRWFQLLLALLSLATASLRLSFLSMATACLSEHVSKPSTFTDFYSAALLARRSSQFAAVLLTLLILKMVGTLRFVRRWVVFGRVLRQACREIGGAALLLVLLLLMFSHLGSLLFSGTVEGFRTQEQAGCSLLRLLRGRKVLCRLCKQHPVVGPLYCLSVLGTVFCVVGRLCGVVLVRMYATVKAEIHRPSIEPQDYEMVEFFIKRLKLWMGLSKTKEFRHRVQFEGMVSPPSRTSQASEKSRLSDSVSPTEPRLSSSASSLNSDTSTVSDSYDVQAYLERLLPCVDSLLEGFDRVNHLAGEVYIIELQLQEAQSRMASKQKMQEPHGVTAVECDATPLTSPPVSSPSSALPFVQAPPSCFHSTPPRRATHSESIVLQTSSHHIGSIKDPAPNVNIELSRFPRRRAWHSGICHSADVTQRSPRSRRSVSIPVRPRSEEGDRGPDLDCLPVKRTAWHPETSEAGRK